MKTHPHLLPIFGISLLLMPFAPAQKTIAVDELRVWQHNDMSSRFTGFSSEGNLVLQPGAAFPSGNAGPTSSAEMRIEGIDLDGVGGADDYIDFSLRFDAARETNPQTNWSGAGIAVNGDFFEPHEQLTVSVLVTDVSVDGWVTLDGFTAATLYLGGNDIPTNGQTDLNGTTVTITNDYTGMGFMFENRKTSIPGLPSTVVVNNTMASDGDFRLRSVDFTITYDPDGVQPPPPPIVFTANDLNLRPDPTFFVFPFQGQENQGGTSMGMITAQPGFDQTTIDAANPTDFLLRWEGLDLDGVGDSDDYVDFTLRATALESAEFVSFTGEGIGINGGGTNGLDDGEQLQFEVVDIVLSPGTAPGTVAFDGFSEAGFFASGFSAEGATTGDAQCAINGETVMVSLDGVGYTPVFGKVALDLAPSVVFDMAAYTAGSITPVGRARDFDLQFSYQVSLEPEPPFEITSFSYDPATGEGSVTWTSMPGQTYIVHTTESLEGSEGDLADDVQANEGADTTSFPFTLQEPFPSRLFLFVEAVE